MLRAESGGSPWFAMRQPGPGPLATAAARLRKVIGAGVDVTGSGHPPRQP